MKTIIVLPTYNEKKNIGILIPQLQSVFKKIKKHSMHILVVDDTSPDGTAAEVKKLQKKYRNLHLISGEKQGLGVAYLRGFNHAIDKLNAEVVFSMDADLSHPPALIPQFMNGIDEGYDLVVGSRYIRGGGTPDWDLKRKVISRGGNFFARVVSGMYSVHDCTSGFRAIRASAFKKMNPSHLHTRGYAFLSTFLYELLSTGSKAKEVPLVFHDRQFGETKLKTRDMVEFFLNALRLRLKSSSRMMKFATVGGSGILVNLAIFTSARNILFGTAGESNWTLLGSSLLGDEISLVYNFLLNQLWTFKDSTNTDHLFTKLMKFHVVALTSVVINNSILFLLHKGFGVPDVFAKFIGILCAFLWNYLVNVKWTWREKIE